MIITAPNMLTFQSHNYCVFLGGAIDNDAPRNWQTFVADILEQRINHVVLFNPCRVNWTPMGDQTTNNQNLRDQINWELDALMVCDTILMYLLPGSVSPISLLELGLYLRSNSKLVVCCPDGFYWQTSIDITCQRAGVQVYRTIEAAIDEVVQRSKRLCRV
jgi:hypothetical protein